MGARSRRKGRAWEQEVARRLRDMLPGCEVVRTASLQAHVAAHAPDVTAGNLLAVECKCGAAPNVWAALDQMRAAEAAAEPDGRFRMVAVHRDSSGGGRPAKECVVMEWATFAEIVAALWAETKPSRAR